MRETYEFVDRETNASVLNLNPYAAISEELRGEFVRFIVCNDKLNEILNCALVTVYIEKLQWKRVPKLKYYISAKTREKTFSMVKFANLTLRGYTRW